MQPVVFLHDSLVLSFEWLLLYSTGSESGTKVTYVLGLRTNLLLQHLVHLIQLVESFCGFKVVVKQSLCKSC